MNFLKCYKHSALIADYALLLIQHIYDIKFYYFLNS